MNRYPVSAEYSPDGWESPGIAFEDYTRCHTEQHLGRLPHWVPEFALNTEQLQIVLMARAWRYAHGTAPFPQNTNWERLNEAATARALRGFEIHPAASANQFAKRDKHIEAVQRAGGYLQLQGAIAFRAWRLNQDSVTVADSLGLTSVSVRVTLERLRATAEQLGFPTGKQGYTRGTKRRRPNALVVAEQIAVNADWAVQYVEESRRAGLRIDDFAAYVDFARRLNIEPMRYEHWRMLEPQCKPQKLREHQAAFSPA